MKRTMSIRHCRQHNNFNNDLKCHRPKISKEFKYSVYFFSPIKIYSLLYLGLLINQDTLQLGDLLRFIREGHLTFNKYTHLFPDDKLINITNNNKNSIFSSEAIRVCTSKMAKFLNTRRFIEIPDCTELCHRYCKEMNLPGKLEVFTPGKKNLVIPKYLWGIYFR